SFYPIGNVFVGYVILNAPLPPDIGYLWIEPVLRLLAIPACVYSFGRRLFGPRTAAIGVLLYLGTPSILFNDAVQQGFGTIFFAVLTKPIFLLHMQTWGTAITNLIAPEMTTGGGSGSNLGRTFTQFEIGWLVATLIGLFLLAFFTAMRHRATRHNPFDLANG